MMKKIWVILLSLLLLFSVAGCSSTNSEENTTLTDADFIANLGKGLEARWDLSGQDTSQMSISEEQAHLTKCIDAETQRLETIDRYIFEDTELEALAQQYFNALDLQREGVQYQGTEKYTEYGQTFELGYYYRIVLINQFYQNYGLTVGKNYQTTLEDMLAEKGIAEENVAIQEYINDLSSKLDYVKDEEKSDQYSTYYTALIENTTEYTIDSLEICLSFVDAEGVTVEQTSEYINDFTAGQKYKSTVYVGDTEFDHIEYSIKAYSYS